jgi:N-acetylglutamate synthase
VIETTKIDLPGQRIAASVTEDAVAAYYRAWQAMVATFPLGSYVESDGVVRARTGLPVPPFNGVWGLHGDVDPTAVLAAVDEFAAGDLPWNVQLRPGHSAELAEAFAQRGLVPTDAIPFMVQTADSTLHPADPPSMRELVTFHDADSALSLLERGFGMPVELTRGAFPMAMMFLPGVSSSLASYEGVDVSMATGVTDGAMVGIFNVATPPEHRGHGFGAAVTAQAVTAGRAAGATTAYLQSSPMGYPVYVRLGFRTVERWQQWMPASYVTHEH